MHPSHNEVVISTAVLTVSDTRTKDTDTGGQLIQSLLQDAGFTVADYCIERDEPTQIVQQLLDWCRQPSINAIIITGGTGFSPRDQTFDAVTPLFEKEMTGFGELFRSLSYEEIGPRAMFSRAVAGCRQETAIYLLPGSKNAVDLAMQKLILPTVQHFVGELNRR